MKFKKKAIFLIGAVVVLASGGIIITKNNDTSSLMTEEQIQTKDIKTYYTFSGNVKAKNSQVITLNSDAKIDEVLKKEGEKVEDGDSLIKTTSGTKLKSKIDGEVSEILVSEGVEYPLGTQVATVVNYDELQVEIKVDEYEVDSIKIGDKVDVYINALDKTVEGKIVNLSKSATVSEGISYFRGIVEIEDTTDILVGMSVEVKAINDNVENVKTIPMNALEFDSENQPFVYVKDSNDKVIERYVAIGVNDGSDVEIKSGLKSGDIVLSSNKSDIFNPFEIMQNGGK